MVGISLKVANTDRETGWAEVLHRLAIRAMAWRRGCSYTSGVLGWLSVMSQPGNLIIETLMNARPECGLRTLIS